MILSSAGAKPKEPPQTMQAFVFFIILRSLGKENSTLAIASITSAVPAAAVMAREEVFGIINPAEAHIDTTRGVVMFPAIPPMLCLSATFPLSLNFFPVLTIALIKYSTSFTDIPHLYIAETKYAISGSVSAFLTISEITFLISFSF